MSSNEGLFSAMSAGGETSPVYEAESQACYTMAKELYDLGLSAWQPIKKGWRAESGVKAVVSDLPLYLLVAEVDFYPKNTIDEAPDRMSISLSGYDRVGGKDVPLTESTLLISSTGEVEITHLDSAYDQAPTSPELVQDLVSRHFSSLSRIYAARDTQQIAYSVTFFGRPQTDQTAIYAEGEETANRQPHELTN